MYFYKMIKLLISIYFTVLSFFVSAQIDFKNPPWKTGCESDSAANQPAMNECSYVQFNIADSILNTLYEFHIKKQEKFHNEIKEWHKDDNDSFTLNLLKQSENLINSIKKSKADFIAFRTSSCDIIKYQYQGGSMAPLARNYHALELTVNQIRILEEMKNE